MSENSNLQNSQQENSSNNKNLSLEIPVDQDNNSNSQNPSLAIPVQQDNNSNNQNPSLAIPINHQPVIITPMSHILDELKLAIYCKSKVVKILALIDIIFLVISVGISIARGNFFWLFIFFFPLCYLGYSGAKNYEKSSILAYSFYILVMSIYYFMLTFYYNSFFLLLIFFIELYFLFYTIGLYRLLNQSPQEVINSLKDGWSPNNYVYYFY